MKWNMIIPALACILLVAGTALPASAAQPWNPGKEKGLKADIETDLKDELWAIHGNYRMQAYSLHQAEAVEVISALDRYGYDTTPLGQALDGIEGLGPELQQALEGKDREALHAVNNKLRVAWLDFLKTLRKVLGAGSPAGSPGWA